MLNVNLNISDILYNFQKDFLKNYSFQDEVFLQFYNQNSENYEAKLNKTEVNEKILKLRIQQAIIYRSLLININKLLPIKKTLIYNYYRNKIIWDRYSKLYLELELEINSEDNIKFICINCDKNIDIDKNLNFLSKEVNEFSNNISDIKNININYLHKTSEINEILEDFINQISFEIVLSRDKDFYLNDLFYINHKDC
ncbi:hypothetical protein [Spiroplasma endosymbiont of Cantharis rufa]|uniref:hypothetical protein n=1 Tax=Spiroplasma endosymbiont of Cantharis rufa TaxID=3066279 RepID=UPI0030D2DEB3